MPTAKIQGTPTVRTPDAASPQGCDAPRNLADILAPLTPDEFLANSFGKAFERLTGQPGRFAGLLPWTCLNRILEQHRLDTPRLRLMRDGKAVPPDSYTTYRSSRRHPQVRIPRLRSQDLTTQLRAGATLIIDSVDELYEPLTALSESLEQAFRARIQVNLYAGWRTSHGFDVHWDDHDVLILQIAGRKHWKVYPMTREYPLSRDIEPAGKAPATPLWEGLLEDGALLYIPRGWWHVAVPLDEPTLHLTVGIHNPTGVDFLSWFSDRLRACAAVRQDLPRFGSPGERAAWMESVRGAWQSAWAPELLEQYLAEADGNARRRPHFTLPWSASPGVLPPGDGWTVQWIVPRGSEWQESNGTLSIDHGGFRWAFSAKARPILDTLGTARVCSLDDLCASAGGSLDRATVRLFVKELAGAGLATVHPEDSAE